MAAQLARHWVEPSCDLTGLQGKLGNVVQQQPAPLLSVDFSKKITTHLWIQRHTSVDPTPHPERLSAARVKE